MGRKNAIKQAQSVRRARERSSAVKKAHLSLLMGSDLSDGSDSEFLAKGGDHVASEHNKSTESSEDDLSDYNTSNTL